MLIAKTFAIGAELTNCIDSPGQSPVARAGGGRDMDGLRVALECVAITLCCVALRCLCAASVASVCALPKRRLTSAAAAALATCRKLTESTARRKLVLVAFAHCVPRAMEQVSQSRDKDTQTSRRRHSQSVAVRLRRLIRVINKSKV